MKKLKRKYQVKVNQVLLAAVLSLITFVIVHNTPFSFASPSNFQNFGSELAKLDSAYSGKDYLGTEVLTTVFNNNLNTDDMLLSQQASYKLNEDGRTYTIQKGNTLIEIANHFNLSVEDLMTWNNLRHTDDIKNGQRLIVKTWLPLIDYFVYVDEILMSEKNQEFLFFKSQRLGLDYAMLLAIIELESNYNPNYISDGSDYGYFQINQIFHSGLAESLDTRNAPLEPIINIAWGTHILDDFYFFWKEYGLVGKELEHYVWASFDQSSYGINEKTILQSAAYIETLETTIQKFKKVLHHAIKD